MPNTQLFLIGTLTAENIPYLFVEMKVAVRWKVIDLLCFWGTFLFRNHITFFLCLHWSILILFDSSFTNRRNDVSGLWIHLLQRCQIILRKCKISLPIRFSKIPTFSFHNMISTQSKIFSKLQLKITQANWKLSTFNANRFRFRWKNCCQNRNNS